MKTTKVNIKDLDGIALYYAIGVGDGCCGYSQDELYTIRYYNKHHDSFDSVEPLFKEYIGRVEYNVVFQEYIATSRTDENIFATSALFPEAVAMCAARTIYKDKNVVAKLKELCETSDYERQEIEEETRQIMCSFNEQFYN